MDLNSIHAHIHLLFLYTITVRYLAFLQPSVEIISVWGLNVYMAAFRQSTATLDLLATSNSCDHDSVGILGTPSP